MYGIILTGNTPGQVVIGNWFEMTRNEVKHIQINHCQYHEQACDSSNTGISFNRCVYCRPHSEVDIINGLKAASSLIIATGSRVHSCAYLWRPPATVPYRPGSHRSIVLELQWLESQIVFHRSQPCQDRLLWDNTLFAYSNWYGHSQYSSRRGLSPRRPNQCCSLLSLTSS